MLWSLVEPLLAQNYHVLQYNSRGVGGSSGWPSFTGYKEAEDLKALVQWAMGQISDVRSAVIAVRIIFILFTTENKFDLLIYRDTLMAH